MWFGPCWFTPRPAALASFLVSLVVGLLRLLGVLPDELWTVSFSHFAFIIIFCFWQRIRLALFRPHMVFFDKLCINQSSNDLKEAGILGLGAFVLQSRKMLVLWSEQYFTRLWCVFETMCFLNKLDREQKARSELITFPVDWAVVLIGLSILWNALMIGYHIALESIGNPNQDRSSDMFFLKIRSVVMCMLASVLVPLVNWFGIRSTRSVYELPNLLQDFRIQNSRCFCCTHKHKCPHTGRELICDREMIYGMLATVSSRNVRSRDFLEDFNLQTCDHFGRVFVAQNLGNLPIKYVVYTVMASNLPFLPQLMSRLRKGSPNLPAFGPDLAIWHLRSILEWIHPFQAMLFSVQSGVLLWRCSRRRRSVCLSILIAPLQTVMVGLSWLCFRLLITLTDAPSLLILLPFFAVFLVNALLYVGIQRSTPRFQPKSPSQSVESEAQTWEVEEDGDTLVTWKF